MEQVWALGQEPRVARLLFTLGDFGKGLLSFSPMPSEVRNWCLRIPWGY